MDAGGWCALFPWLCALPRTAPSLVTTESKTALQGFYWPVGSILFCATVTPGRRGRGQAMKIDKWIDLSTLCHPRSPKRQAQGCWRNPTTKWTGLSGLCSHAAGDLVSVQGAGVEHNVL